MYNLNILDELGQLLELRLFSLDLTPEVETRFKKAVTVKTVFIVGGPSRRF